MSAALRTLDKMFPGPTESYLVKLEERSARVAREVLRVLEDLLQVFSGPQTRAAELQGKIDEDYRVVDRIVSNSTDRLLQQARIFADRVRGGMGWSPDDLDQSFGDDRSSITVRNEVHDELFRIHARGRFISSELSNHRLRAAIDAANLFPETFIALDGRLGFDQSRNPTLDELTRAGIDLGDRVPSLRLITDAGETIMVVRRWIAERVDFDEFLKRFRFLVTLEAFLDWLESEGIALFGQVVGGFRGLEAHYLREIDQLLEDYDRAIARYFRHLVEVWKEKSQFLSSTDAMADLPPYREIVAIGRSFVPYLLREVDRTPDYWFMALAEITGVNPIFGADRGNLKRMSDAWLQWGRANNVLF